MAHGTRDLHALAALSDVDLDAALTALRALYADVDARNQRHTAGLDLPCHRGCSACCRDSVFLTPLEFLGAWDHVQQHWSAAAREAAIDRGLAAYRTHRAVIDACLRPPPPGERDHFSVVRDLRFDCPLLDDDGACGVYPMREMFGRLFGCSFNDDGGVYGCDLVGAHLADQTVTLLRARPTARRIDDLPLTGMRQVYPWYIHWLYGARDEDGHLVDDDAAES